MLKLILATLLAAPSAFAWHGNMTCTGPALDIVFTAEAYTFSVNGVPYRFIPKGDIYYVYQAVDASGAEIYGTSLAVDRFPAFGGTRPEYLFDGKLTVDGKATPVLCEDHDGKP